MEKLKLYHLKKSDTHIFLEIKKSKLLIDELIKFLEKLKIPHINTLDLLGPLGTIDDNYSKRDYSDKLYTDEVFFFENKNYKISIFFGKKQAFISIFTIKNDQERVSKLIFNFCDF